MDKQALGIELDNKWNSREDHRRVEGVMRGINQTVLQLLKKIPAKGTTLYEWAYQYGGLQGLARQADTEIKRAYFTFRRELDAFLKGLPETDVNQFYHAHGKNPQDWSFIKMSSEKRASRLFQKRAEALEGVRDSSEVVELADLRDHFETTLSKDKRESVVDHENDPSTENYPEAQPTHEEERDQAPEFKEPEKSGPCKTSAMTDQLALCKTAQLSPEDADGTCWGCGEEAPGDGALYCDSCQGILADELDETAGVGDNVEGIAKESEPMEVQADQQGDISAEIISDPSMDYLIDTFGTDDTVLARAIRDHFSPLYPTVDLEPIIKNIIDSLNTDVQAEGVGDASPDPQTNTAPERVQNAGGALADF